MPDWGNQFVCVLMNCVRRVQIADLSEKVQVDSLTGLYNYRHFQQLAEQELERTRRNGHPTALIMVRSGPF